MRGLTFEPFVRCLTISSDLAFVDDRRGILDDPRNYIVVARYLRSDPGLQSQLDGPHLALDGLDCSLDYSIRARAAYGRRLRYGSGLGSYGLIATALKQL